MKIKYHQIKILIFLFFLTIKITHCLYHFRSFDQSDYELSHFIKNSNLPFAKFNFLEINQTFSELVNQTEFNFTEIIKENSQRFNIKILKRTEKNIEKEVSNIEITEIFSPSNLFYNSKIRNTLQIDFFNNINNEVKCEINYPGLLYNENNFFSGFNQNKNFNGVNFISYDKLEGIFLIKFSNGVLVKQVSLGKMIGEIDNELKIDQLMFEDIHISENINENKYHLILREAENSNIYLFSIIKNNNKDFNIDIQFVNIFEKNQFYSIDIEKSISFGVFSGNYFIVLIKDMGYSSINIISYSSKVENIQKITKFKDPEIENEININIVDSVISKNNCYIAIENFGLISFNFSNKEFKVILKHPKITRIIFTKTNFDYLGILLNNEYKIENEFDSREFYIELRKNSERTFEINKIFYSSLKIKEKYFENYFHNEISDSIMFISEEKKEILYVKKNIPNIYDNIDGIFPIPKDFNPKTLKCFILENINDDKSENFIIIQDKSNKKNYSNITINKNGNINCQIKNSGNFTVINSYFNYDQIDKIYELNSSIRKIEILLDEITNSFELLIVIFILVFLIIISLILYFYYRKKKRNSTLIYNYAQLDEL